MNTFSSKYSQVFSQNIFELWNAISVENNLNNSHPFCKENKSIQWSAETHKDILIYLKWSSLYKRFFGVV